MLHMWSKRISRRITRWCDDSRRTNITQTHKVKRDLEEQQLQESQTVTTTTNQSTDDNDDYVYSDADVVCLLWLPCFAPETSRRGKTRALCTSSLMPLLGRNSTRLEMCECLSSRMQCVQVARIQLSWVGVDVVVVVALSLSQNATTIPIML